MCPAKQPTIFGNIAAKNVTFLLDISGSMYRTFECVKEHCIRALTEKSLKEYDGMFNIIAFSDNVYPWARTVMPCTPRTVKIATEWIRSLECKASTNTHDALMLAMQDPGTDASYLLTDGLPDNKSSLILQNISRVSQGRPVHCLYVTGSHNDHEALEFLKNLATVTEGSLRLLSLDNNGEIKNAEKVAIIEQGKRTQMNFGGKSGCFENNDEYFYGSRIKQPHWVDDYSLSQSRECLENKYEYDNSSLAASMMNGKQVLARRDADGFYYLGKVTEVNSSNTFKVQFDPCSALQFDYLEQDVSLHNLITYGDALRHDIYVGEKVLAPFNQDGKYGPGVVIEGSDVRKQQLETYRNDSVLISKFNGETKRVASGVAIWISDELYERIQKEIFFPESLRKSSTYYEEEEKSFNGNYSLPKRWHYEAREEAPSISDVTSSTADEVPLDHLRCKIERQIEESELILQKLYLEDRKYAEELGYAQSDESNGNMNYYERPKRVQPTIDENSFTDWREKVLSDAFRSKPEPTKDAWIAFEEEGDVRVQKGKKKIEYKSQSHLKKESYHKHRLELLNHWEKNKHEPKYSPFISSHIPAPSKEMNPKKLYAKDQKQVKSKRITFRTPPPAKAYTEPRMGRRRCLTEPRPNAKEYHAHDGIPFPPSTDRKFIPSPNVESWTVNKACQDLSQPMNIITNKPIEHYTNAPMDRRRTVELNNTRNAALEKRERDIATHRAKSENIVKKREEFHRIDKERKEHERYERVRKFKEGEELHRQKRQDFRENFFNFQREKEDRAQSYKQGRIDAMRERRFYNERKETDRERKVFEEKEKSLGGRVEKKGERRDAFQVSLDNEIKIQEKQLKRLRKIHSSRLNFEDTRTDRAYKTKDLNHHVQDQTRQIFRASILP